MDPEEREVIIEKLQKRMRRNNWNYLSRHAEVRAIIRVILEEVIKEQPENIYNFTASLFQCENLPHLSQQINGQLQRLQALMKENTWTKYDGDMAFTEKTSKRASEHSAASSFSAMESLLKFSIVEQEPDQYRDDIDPLQSASEREIIITDNSTSSNGD